MIIRIFTILSAALIFSCGGKKESTETYAPPAKSETQAEAEVEHPGKSLFQQHCGACHQLDGSGVPGMYPPLQESEYVNGDVNWLVSSLVNGLEGPITVKGVEYDNLMPAMDYLTSEEIAHILSYVRQSFGNKASEVTAEEVQKIRDEAKGS
mgnify:CR=1 FL=1